MGACVRVRGGPSAAPPALHCLQASRKPRRRPGRSMSCTRQECRLARLHGVLCAGRCKHAAGWALQPRVGSRVPVARQLTHAGPAAKSAGRAPCLPLHRRTGACAGTRRCSQPAPALLLAPTLRRCLPMPPLQSMEQVQDYLACRVRLVWGKAGRRAGRLAVAPAAWLLPFLRFDHPPTHPPTSRTFERRFSATTEAPTRPPAHPPTGPHINADGPLLPGPQRQDGHARDRGLRLPGPCHLLRRARAGAGGARPARAGGASSGAASPARPCSAPRPPRLAPSVAGKAGGAGWAAGCWVPGRGRPSPSRPAS